MLKVLKAAALASLAAPVLSANIFVKVTNKTGQQLNVAELEQYTRAERRQMVHSVLDNVRKVSQADIVTLLKARNIPHKTHWINNSIFIPNCPEDLVAELKGHSDVIDIYEEHMAHLIEPTSRKFGVKKEAGLMVEWNLSIINIEGAWNVTQGENVVVSNIDTGVRWTHESLTGSYRGADGSHDYNWWDPERRFTTAPGDGNGHGTHTMGTIAGSEEAGIGVAPGSKWIASKGCRTALCPESDLTDSAEWVICPWDLNGGNPDCTQGADVISNSWGGGNGDDWYLEYTDAWIAAGSVPVFAQGNSGPTCGSANSPGDYVRVIGVGATDSNDRLAAFSSRGPGTGVGDIASIKPDISAPGAGIRSAYHTSDTAYSSLSGTSMACPHITGVVALILSVNPSLSFDNVMDIITSTADTDYGTPNGGQTTCGGIDYTQIPNNHYGHGRVNAAAAVAAASTYKKH